MAECRLTTVWLAICYLAAAFLFKCSTELLEGAEGAPLIPQAYVDSRGCPLSLSVLNYEPHCFDGELGKATTTSYNLTLPLCCAQVMAGLWKLMITHTNSTRMLFLEEAEGEACLGELAQDETLTRCVQAASKFVANKSPCTAFATREALAAQLNMLATSSWTSDQVNANDVAGEGQNQTELGLFGSLSHQCGPQSGQHPVVDCSSCSTSFKAAVELLNVSLHDDSDVCAVALFLSLASTVIDDPVWANSLYACAWQDLVVHRPQQGSRRILPWMIIIIGIVIGSLTTFFASVVYSKLNARKDKKRSYYRNMNPITLEKSIMEQGFSYDDSRNFACSVGLYSFSLEEIMNATNHFNNENLLGKGEAGRVFKGVLPSGQFVAVKQIDKDNKPHTFKTELISLSKVRHAHLVTLMGFCQASDAYYLVYEYCSNGDLSKWLFVTNDDAQVLSWEQRVRIAVNTARGLWFLHNYPGGSIVHRDIKPTNILLNEHLEAKLSDFGLARHMETDNSHVMTEVKGTTGYLDPEYMSMGELTQASDVYSFGIVLLQLISGRRAIDLDPRHRSSLLKIDWDHEYETLTTTRRFSLDVCAEQNIFQHIPLQMK